MGRLRAGVRYNAPMERYSRRTFTVLAAGSVAGAAPGEAIPTRRLGRINFQAGILGLGAQRIGEPSATQAIADRVVGEAIDNGLNYIDTAPTYNLSEERLGKALKGKRDKVFLVSKVQTLARSDVLSQIRASLHKLQTDHLDAVHIHNVGRDDRYPELRYMLRDEGTLGGLREAKKQGMIHHIGCTSHMRPARTLAVFETSEFDLFMCTLNFVERHIYNYEETVLPEARRRNTAVIGMKVLGGPVSGPGARLMEPEDYNATLRYAWSLPGVAVAIVGMRTPEEVRQGLAAARAFQPLQTSELNRLLMRGKEMATAWGPLRGPVA
jgi:aryl-alcohol dehydrogenase-like predicted oxidoreductase